MHYYNFFITPDTEENRKRFPLTIGQLEVSEVGCGCCGGSSYLFKNRPEDRAEAEDLIVELQEYAKTIRDWLDSE